MTERIWLKVGHRVGQSVASALRGWHVHPTYDGDAWWHDGDGEWFREQDPR